MVLGLVAALVAPVAGLLLRLVAVLTAVPVFVPLAADVVDLLVPTVVTLDWALEVETAEELTGFLLGPEGPTLVVGFFLSAALVEAGMGFLVGVLAADFVRPLATRLWVALGRVPGPVVAGPAAVVLPLTGPLDLVLASTAFPGASFTVGGAACSFWGSSGCGGDGVVPF